MTATRPLCVQIAALGGQGGGVLTEWLSNAAERHGFPSQATSIPGVAQRTGATTYYFEMLPEKDVAGQPVFSLFPDADDIDLMASMEPTEAGRAMERGLITGRTTVITANRRIYSTAEKSVAGDGIVPAATILDALQQAAGKLIQVDAEVLAQKAGAQGNAVLFGAIAGAGVLPLDIDNCRAAIEAKGVAVAANLSGFEAGLEAVQTPQAVPEDPLLFYAPIPEAFVNDMGAIAEDLWPIIGHGLSRLVDYQGVKYARLYLKRLKPFLELESQPPRHLTGEVAKRLAAWMSYEDVIRVAQLKSRPGRFTDIRDDLNLEEGAPLTVVDYLKPGREELASLLPPGIGHLVMALPKSAKTGGLKLKIDATSLQGYLSYRLLAGLRGWRRFTYRYGQEQKAINIWLKAVEDAAARDTELARRVTKMALLARGYGDVRHRGLARLKDLLKDFKARLESDAAAVSATIDEALEAARNDPDGDCRGGST